ncbi:hypothetical protein AZE99_08005 [Sphingorhabdus sp. M41]|nr:universal stress protein [Sphingorhabdus sp. M41]AMO71801.1 hypothetical protein AZE99_08005 [Sphingorhabdus sp. M41]
MDNSPDASFVFRHTKAVASGLDIPVRLAHVLQGGESGVSPSDPIEWQIKVREARDYLSRILKSDNSPFIEKDRLLLNGIASEEISRWASENADNLIALATRCGLEHSASKNSGHDLALGRTAQMVLDNSAASLLLVPPGGQEKDEICYRRLAVPLDGSCRAESVLPFAVRIARKHGAELLLTHVIPRPEIMVTGLHDAEASEFTTKLEQFNEQNARAYLDRLQRRLASGGIAVRAIIENEGDVRERLLLIAEYQRADLIVMSARGKGSIHDMPCGNVARHIAAHTRLPLLLIRQKMSQPVDHLKMTEHHYGPRMFWESAH